MEELISLKEITVTAQSYEILSQVSLSIHRGKCTIVMGPSGCGKSTLLKVAAGLIVPDRGKVFWEGEELSRLSEKKLRQFRKMNGFVFQDAALWANRSIFENLALPLQFHHPELSASEIDRQVNGHLARMSLISSSPLRPSQLSQGERKIVSFLRAIILQPSILFLDEPTSFIDHEMLEKMMKVIGEYRERSCTIVAVTHDAHLTSMIADDLAVLKEGRVLASGQLSEVRRNASREVSAILSQVLSQAATYDSDLLDLLGG